jgi:hypothetical protein
MTDLNAAGINERAAAVIERLTKWNLIATGVAAVATLSPLLVQVDASSGTRLVLVLIAAVGLLRLPASVSELIRLRRWTALTEATPWERRSVEPAFRPFDRHRPLLVRLDDVEGEQHVFGQSASPWSRRLEREIRRQAELGAHEWWTCSHSARWVLLATDDGEHLIEVRRAWSSWGDRAFASRFADPT